MRCPRRDENPMGGKLNPIDAQDEWRPDHTCPYCGSYDPDLLMELIEAGNVELGPTDKNYKVYMHPVPDGPKFPLGSGIGKFYFQHFSTEQRKRFVELLNDKKLRIGVPGHFYVPPFFCVPVSRADLGRMGE